MREKIVINMEHGDIGGGHGVMGGEHEDMGGEH